MRRRTRVYVPTVTEIVDDWRNSVNMARRMIPRGRGNHGSRKSAKREPSCFPAMEMPRPFPADHLLVTLHGPGVPASVREEEGPDTANSRLYYPWQTSEGHLQTEFATQGF